MDIGVFIVEKHRRGDPDEFIILPICDGCRKPIIDLELANAVWAYPDGADFKGEPLGNFDGVPINRQNCELSFYHKKCDGLAPKDKYTCWTGAGCVFKMDQHREIEK